MKRCPKCNSQYSDLTLSFCLQDGTPLADIKQSSVDTLAFGRPITAEKIFTTREYDIDVTAQPPAPTQFVHIPQPAAVPQKTSRKWLFAAIALPVLLVLSAGGVGGWMYMSNQRADKLNMLPVSADKPEGQKQSDKPDTDDQFPETENQADDENLPPASKAMIVAARKEVSQVINAWKTAAESHKAADYAAFYGEKVEYFDRAGVTPAEIKAEMQKLFDAYSEVDIDITNMVIAIDAEGTAATALFDKEWSYEASPKLSEGKAHTKLHLRKVDDQWKIVTEENLKVYYTEN